jgi:hypothetical protein
LIKLITNNLIDLRKIRKEILGLLPLDYAFVSKHPNACPGINLEKMSLSN